MNKSYLLAFVMAVAVIGWIFSGQLQATVSDDEATKTEQDTAGKVAKKDHPVTVRVRLMQAQPHQREVVLRGRTQAVRSVAVKTEIAGRITHLAVTKGKRVKAGDLLAKIDMQDRAARLTEARALVKQRQMEFKAAIALSKKGYRAETKLAGAQTQLDSAKALVKRIELEIQHTEVRAPFAGIVDTKRVEIGDYMKVAEVVATIVDQNPYLVVGDVSEREVSYLKVGQKATAELITKKNVSGKIRFIASTANSATRTFRVEIQVPNPKRDLRDGVTARIRIPVDNSMAHLITPAVMTLNDQGQLGVKTVTQEGIVRFIPAQIIADGENGVWLAGLPEMVGIITVGQDFVRHGDQVLPVIENDPRKSSNKS
ncbi:MAG: efflux RND transporter periplasmic adaptor subunit [Alphaproteobacteria bacterium]|jgi:multidrug efflux system membrane fusion protein|nr:efflux RND transporter periplasmic adaptor subunit [Alphaproteobacteria bacterium]MBT4020694.1 efflux RND transporter periplasmic adaptor subunit [Alphaproteobacteria bacterium]MBT5161190.1 efflux RND transporter periplasmic adaptor subunit [Alphaproteobacteria bacterium]MBT5916882.1 efflux RND transporter periplasmic adaptor subunit [Alphaproteobacteria bacterium]MBT6386106.1 efflux RND transporter periplasmic adaptor subunit [Alphaproteobacteria bacterium]